MRNLGIADISGTSWTHLLPMPNFRWKGLLGILVSSLTNGAGDSHAGVCPTPRLPSSLRTRKHGMADIPKMICPKASQFVITIIVGSDEATPAVSKPTLIVI